MKVRNVSDESRPQATNGAPKRKAEVPKKRTVGRVILASVVVLALVTGLGMVYLYRHLNGNLDIQDVSEALGDDRPEEVYAGNGQPLDILVMGDDTRSGDNKIDQETGGGSDTTILVHLSADRSRAYAVSIPRDSIVERPDCGEDDEIAGGSEQMWNRAYALGAQSDPQGAGGAACAIRQLEATTGIRVENYIVVDFSGFQDMVDAVDGVPVCVPEEIDDPAHDVYIPAGDPVILEGDQALDYVRARYKIGDGSDLGRIKRQQTFIAALVNKVKSADTLARLDRVVAFLNAATESLGTDFTSITRLGKVAMQLQNIGLDKIKFITVPNAYYPRDSEHFGRVYWTEEADQLWNLLKQDRVLPRKFLDGSINAGNVPGANKTPKPSPDDSPSQTQAPSETPTASPSESPSGTESPDASPTQTPTTSPSLGAEEAAEVGLCS